MSRETIIVIGIGIALIVLSSLFIFGIIRLPSFSEEKLNEEEHTTMATQSAGLKIEDREKGTGERAVQSGDTILIHYTGTLEDGTKFDSSVDRGQPFQTQIGVGSVIEGWDKGVIGMKVGGKRKLTIPPEMGYGDQTIPGIPANSTLIFDVELVEILQ